MAAPRSLPSAATAARCAAGLASADGGRGAPHLDAFLVGRFGAGIADAFLRPYNRKLWGHDLTTLSTDWVGERIASARPAAAEAGPALRRVPLVEESVVGYPADGGFGAIPRALARRLPDVRLRAEGETVPPTDDACVVRCGGGELLRIALRVDQTGIGLGFSKQESSGAAAADAGGGNSVEDVLF